MNSQLSEVHLLIIDDDEEDFLITQSYIQHIPGHVRYRAEWCADYQQALRKLEQNDHHIYMIDYKLSGHTGLELLEFAHKKGNDNPIILLTGKGNTEVDREAMQLGATDYLVKTELTVEKLERAIRYALGRRADTIALKENERKFRSVFENSADTLFMLDETLNFVDINHAGELLFQKSKKDLLGRPLAEYIGGQDAQRLFINSMHEGKSITDLNITLETDEGNYPCILSVNVYKSQEHIPIHGILHDMTERVREHQKNMQTEKQASAFRLVNLMAHEVRNPLSNIMLAIDAIQTENKTEEGQALIDIVQRNSLRISTLIDELLNASRPGKTHNEEIHLQEVIQEVINRSTDRAQLKDIDIQVIVPEEPIMVQGEKEKLVIALLNIIINAIEAVDEGEGLVKCRLFAQKNKAVLTIEDNGCGMDNELLTRIFEPYFTNKHNGMGIGLSAAYNILKAHDSDLDVRSKVGEGTTFLIEIPTNG